MSSDHNPLRSDDVEVTLASVFSRTNMSNVAVGIAEDDCATLLPDVQCSTWVVTTDYVNANPIGRTLNASSWADVGAYLVNSNISDLLGSGASPRYLLTSIMWPRHGSTDDFYSLCAGIAKAADIADATVVGGDTKLGSSPVLCATAIGHVKSAAYVRRKSSALVGHNIWVSGPLGSCAAATVALSREVALNPCLETWATERIARPTLPLSQARALASRLRGCGGTDISDGLGLNIANMCARSRVSAVIDYDSLPVEREAARIAEDCSLDPKSFALILGGDLQFVVTCPPSHDILLHSAGFVHIGKIVNSHSSRSTVSITTPDISEGVTLPDDLGHKDGRRQTFVEEIWQLLNQTERLLHG